MAQAGNDYFGGSHCTGDGIKAAVTDSMAVLTGIQGHYDSQRCPYLYPKTFITKNILILPLA